MNYRKHYDLLIKKAQTRILEGNVYYEKHHIRPRSEGGSDDLTNIVKLTAREHFIAHWLLYRDNPNINSRAHSFWRLCNGRGKVQPKDWIIIPSRAYEEARIAHSAAISKSLKGKSKSPEHVSKVAEANRGKKRTMEARKRMSNAAKGREMHPNTKKALELFRGYNGSWNKGVPMTDERKQRQAAMLTGNNNAGKSCIVNGTPYISVVEASKALNSSQACIKHRIRSKSLKYQSYYYI